jgi:N-terminal region of glycosyl transferase group 7
MSSDNGGPDESLNSGVSDKWRKFLSVTHKQVYWFNLSTGERSWVDPGIVESSLKKTRNEESENSKEKHLSSSSGTERSWVDAGLEESRLKKRRNEESEKSDEKHLSSSSGTERSWVDAGLVESNLKKRRIEESEKSDEKHLSSSNGTKSSSSSRQKSAAESTKVKPEIAIIVPYRDLHVKQRRKQQLDLFIPSISKFMELKKDRSSYRIYIIEQSNDGRKFNRGKLLNIGFKIACADGCKAFIFHDVDLLPSEGMSLPSIFMHMSFLVLTVCF